MNLKLELQITGSFLNLPGIEDFKAWAAVALEGQAEEVEMVIRVVDMEESEMLNRTYRGIGRPTNVLSFPFQAPQPVSSDLLGDLVICAPVVRREARELGQDVQMHWAHMVVHGILHLLGYDHQTDTEAETMELLEIGILSRLGFSNPYFLDMNGAGG